MQTKRALLKSLTRAVRVVTGAAARAVARMEKKAAVYFSKSWLEKNGALALALFTSDT